ncbi:MAG: spondin domain-containing protein [Sneathiella sp.]
MLKKKISILAASALTALTLTAAIPSAAHAVSVKVTVTNLAGTGGFALTPLYTAFHNSSFDAFNEGDKASAGIEQLAELGDPSDVRDIRVETQPSSVGGVIAAAGNGVPPIEPGESASAVFQLNAQDHSLFTFLSMILPSNDTFIGSDDAIQIFDAGGNFLGDQTINVTGADIYDAGTEINDASASGGAAPFPGAPGGADENGVITAGQSLADFAGLTLFGQVLDANQIDFLSDPENFQVARIQITAVPLPPAVALFGAALFGLGWLSRRRKANTPSA